MHRAQPIRPSQFITTYGPGALLEGAGGPRIVMAIQFSGLFDQVPPRDFEIQEPALKHLLPERAQIFRLPTNAERHVPDREPLYLTEPFPRWSLCVTHNVLYRARLQGNSKGCPQCGTFANRFHALEEARKEAIRFVVACPKGHLDEVPWSSLVAHQKPGCRPDFLRWEGSGGSLRNVTVRCPDCSGAVNLGDAYHRDLRCYGARPELRQQSSDCQEKARITQRGAANLFVPEVLSAVTIPRLDTPLHQALCNNSALSVLQLLASQGGLSDGAAVRRALSVVAQNLPPSVEQTLTLHSDAALFRAASDVVATSFPQTIEQAREAEFRELQKAATHGHPPAPPALPGRPPDFEVVESDVGEVNCGPFRLRVAPVSRLRVVTVQTGYRRLNGELVGSEYILGTAHWYPGAEMFGEGLFLDLAPPPAAEAADHHPASGANWQRWLERNQLTGRPEDHPVFVWWHTLAHRLIRALSVDSGYSSAAVRERVYLRLDGPRATGGVLLYAVQPGGDGTLGGLIALVPAFQQVLDRARNDLGNCSNDPLCEETTIHSQRVNGAGCYACCLVSETSCESRNQSLDRLVLLESGV